MLYRFEKKYIIVLRGSCEAEGLMGVGVRRYGWLSVFSVARAVSQSGPSETCSARPAVSAPKRNATICMTTVLTK